MIVYFHFDMKSEILFHVGVWFYLYTSWLLSQIFYLTKCVFKIYTCSGSLSKFTPIWWAHFSIMSIMLLWLFDDMSSQSVLKLKNLLIIHPFLHHIWVNIQQMHKVDIIEYNNYHGIIRHSLYGILWKSSNER